MKESPVPLADRLAADVFRKSYRQYLALKPTHYRWSHLAPQSIRHLQESVDKNWSVEKLADYLYCEPDEAEACLRRFNMSKKVNAKDTTAGRLREAVFEWIGEVADLDEKTRRKLSDDLSKMVGNQLFIAAQAKEDLLKLSMELEGKEAVDSPTPKEKPPAAEPPKWGPQWKD
ncbi:MAG: hypothetical protein JWP91_3829 [Fibrobacteres bacterium]|nr:hypothetical protein [Fibrobacterota bacterium]